MVTSNGFGNRTYSLDVSALNPYILHTTSVFTPKTYPLTRKSCIIDADYIRDPLKDAITSRVPTRAFMPIRPALLRLRRIRLQRVLEGHLTEGGVRLCQGHLSPLVAQLTATGLNQGGY